jgi:hypothetical protein
MKPGDLVKSKKFNSMGVVVEVFDDLDPNNPWIRVLFTHPSETYQWCKLSGLELLKAKKEK